MSIYPGFHDVDFPFAAGNGATLQLQRLTEVVELRSGFEERNAVWAHARRRWDVGPLVASRADLERLCTFFEARLGRLYAFRFRDPADHSSAPNGAAPSAHDQVLGEGDGVRSRFPLVKRYGAPHGAERPIRLPVHGAVAAAVDGEAAVFSLDAGEIVFEAPPPAGAPVTAGFLFDTPVRFASDALELSFEAGGAGRAGEILLVETRLTR